MRMRIKRRHSRHFKVGHAYVSEARFTKPTVSRKFQTTLSCLFTAVSLPSQSQGQITHNVTQRAPYLISKYPFPFYS